MPDVISSPVLPWFQLTTGHLLLPCAPEKRQNIGQAVPNEPSHHSHPPSNLPLICCFGGAGHHKAVTAALDSLLAASQALNARYTSKSEMVCSVHGVLGYSNLVLHLESSNAVLNPNHHRHRRRYVCSSCYSNYTTELRFVHRQLSV